MFAAAMKLTGMAAMQGIKGVRFKRVIMDEGAEDRSPSPPPEESFKRLIFCSGKASTCTTLYLSMQPQVPLRRLDHECRLLALLLLHRAVR